MQYSEELLSVVRELMSSHLLTINVNSGQAQCQLACKYCSVRVFNAQDYQAMKPEELEIQIDFAQKALEKKDINVHFFGREPLMELDTVLHTRKLLPNSKITVTTNGVQIDQRVAKLLNENNIIVTILSCDGPYHDAHRPFRDGSGSLECVKRAWSLLGDYKWEQTTLRGTWLPGERIVEFFKFQYQEFGTLNATPIPDIDYSDFETEEVAENIIELADYFNGQLPKGVALTDQIRRIENGYSGPNRFCNVNSFTIGPGLKIYSCHHQQPQTYIGSILDGNVDYENVERIKRHMKHSIDQIPKCKNCIAKDICPVAGACPMQFLKTTGDLTTPSDRYCKFALGYAAGVMYWLSLRHKHSVKRRLAELVQSRGGE